MWVYVLHRYVLLKLEDRRHPGGKKRAEAEGFVMPATHKLPQSAREVHPEG